MVSKKHGCCIPESQKAAAKAPEERAIQRRPSVTMGMNAAIQEAAISSTGNAREIVNVLPQSRVSDEQSSSACHGFRRKREEALR